MKKFNVFLALLAVLLMVMTGCGRHGDEGFAGGIDNPDDTASIQLMTEFSINGYPGTIDAMAKTIRVTLPAGTDLKALIATFTASGNVQVNGVDQESGVTPNDFTKPVTYTVTMPDGTTQRYTVAIKRGFGLITPKVGSTTVIDPDKGFISGLKPELTKEEFERDYINPAPAGYHYEYEPNNGVLGTGTKVKVVDAAGNVIDTYTIVIYVDLSGDGHINASDALRVLHVANGSVTWDPATQGHLFEAGDVNGNGFIDKFDAEIILAASVGNLTIDQVTGLPTDFHIIPKAGSTTTIGIDMIVGLESGLTKEKFESDYIQVGDGYRLEYDPNNGVLGTGTKVKVIEIATGNVVKTYTIVIYGDVNGDGNIDSIDAGLIVDFENYATTFNEFQLEAGDVNGDGNVDSIDAGNIVNVENYIMSIDETNGLA